MGITPQLLPAVVLSASLATGSRRLARLKVLVKRLVCIEDLGDIDVLITDKTGTLTEGRISLVDARRPCPVRHADSVLRAGAVDHRCRPGVRWCQRQRDGCRIVGVARCSRVCVTGSVRRAANTTVRPCAPRDLGAAR